ncbi:hypothetical protein TPA0907_55620 [Micromonospora humidisoli]|uniref:hypothetical protein n=1 Tax=Micromonospora sp. AKA109 TaxID=2733865 RepID=UPI0022C445D0|nr:hypothetical protein [Micromonospora sp. AKA109]GHJ11195.1 hypothetical protein TPA0907_55620 [Micromonospora sp. AKA109]
MDPLTAAWRRHDAGQHTAGDAQLFAGELTRAWATHEQIRALVWPLAAGPDGTTHTPCEGPDCTHDGDQPGHPRCLAARILAALHAAPGRPATTREG